MQNRLEDFDLFCTIHKIAECVQATGKRHGCSFQDGRRTNANPSNNQTASGLFIEHYYGMVNRLWTPWGLWRFISSPFDDWEAVWDEVSSLLGAKLYLPMQSSSMGDFGPVFALTKFGDEALPKAEILNHRDYASDEAVKAAWAKMTARYQAL